MYPTLLTLHSLVRWLVLVSLTYAIVVSYRGWLANRVFSKHDHVIRQIATSLTLIQAAIGLWLYFTSPIVNYFLHNLNEAVHQRDTRFFGMEHITMMTLAVTVLIIGSVKTRKKTSDQAKFKTMAIWFTLALVIIFVSIPWGFSPFTSRPHCRGF